MKTCFYPDIVIRVLLVLLTMLILTCDHIYTFAANAANSQPTDKSTQSPIIEYFKDHEVTERQARESLRRMTDVDFQRPSHCKCTDDDFRYCYSSELLKDHCCCNQSHQKEPLYFIPHECYINQDSCYPSLGSCLKVMNIRSCCCDAQLKKHWRHVLASANATRLTRFLWMLSAAVIALTLWS